MFETNEYLSTIFQPWKVTNVRIPDLDMTTSRAKSATLTNNFTVQKGELLLLSTPANNQGQLRLYARTTAPPPSFDATMYSGYVYVTTLPMDEQLADSYIYGRLISSGLRVVSATRPTGTVDINGTMNAIHYQDLPSLKALTFSSIPSYKRNNVDVKSQISVADGIVSLHQPFGEQQFNVFDTNAVEHAETILDIARQMGAFTTTPWPAGAVPANGFTNVAYYGAGLGVIPEGIKGRMRLTATATVTGAPIINAAQAWEMAVTAYTPRLSTADWNTPTNVVTGGFQSFLLGATGATIMMDFYSDAELRGIQFVLTNRNAAAQDAAVTLAAMTLTWTLESFAFYDKGYNGPGALIGISGLNPPTVNYPGQVVSLAGVYNYEVVPNSFLARQVGTEYGTTPENPLLMKAAEFHISTSEMPFLYTGKEYDTAMAIGKIENKLSNQKVLEAAGFGDFLKALLNATKPILSAVPVLGPVVDALTSSGVYRPTSSAGVYSVTANGSYRYPTNPPRRLNAAYVGDYLDDIASLPDPTMLDREDFEVAQGQDFIYLNGEGRAVKDSNSAGSIQQGTLLGLISQVNYGYVSNRFLLVDDQSNRCYVGYVYASSQPLVGQYALMQIPINDADSVTIRVACNATLSKDALWSLGLAAHHAGRPSDFITVVSPLSGELKGPSLGLAALYSMCRRNTYAALTGFVDYDGNVVAISKLENKVAGLVTSEIGRSVPIITPYDEALEESWLKLLREKGEVVDTYASAIGELGVNNKYPRLIFINNISALFLTALNINFMASGGRYTAGAAIPEIKIEAMEVTNTKGVTSKQYVPVKQLEIYDWGYDSGGPADLIKFVSGQRVSEELAYMKEFDPERSAEQLTILQKKVTAHDYAGMTHVLKAMMEFNKSIRDARDAVQPRTMKGRVWTLEDAEAYIQTNLRQAAFKPYADASVWKTVRKNGSALAIVASAMSGGGKTVLALTNFANPGRRAGVTATPQPSRPLPRKEATPSVPQPALSIPLDMVSSLTGDLPAPADLFADPPTSTASPVSVVVSTPPSVEPVAVPASSVAASPYPGPNLLQPAPDPMMAMMNMLAGIQAGMLAQQQRSDELEKKIAATKKGGGPSGVSRPPKQ